MLSAKFHECNRQLQAAIQQDDIELIREFIYELENEAFEEKWRRKEAEIKEMFRKASKSGILP